MCPFSYIAITVTLLLLLLLLLLLRFPFLQEIFQYLCVCVLVHSSADLATGPMQVSLNLMKL